MLFLWFLQRNTSCSEKAHENRLTVIKDNAEQEMTTLRQTNLRRLQELNAEIQRFEIEMREMEEVGFNTLSSSLCRAGNGILNFVNPFGTAFQKYSTLISNSSSSKTWVWFYKGYSPSGQRPCPAIRSRCRVEAAARSRSSRTRCQQPQHARVLLS